MKKVNNIGRKITKTMIRMYRRKHPHFARAPKHYRIRLWTTTYFLFEDKIDKVYERS